MFIAAPLQSIQFFYFWLVKWGCSLLLPSEPIFVSIFLFSCYSHFRWFGLSGCLELHTFNRVLCIYLIKPIKERRLVHLVNHWLL